MGFPVFSAGQCQSPGAEVRVPQLHPPPLGSMLSKGWVVKKKIPSDPQEGDGVIVAKETAGS